MSVPSQAVFLSYASQDAEAAKRLCDALRAAGVEVWFDVEGGLEHGDEWDAKIRRQIKECVLFIPLISANTQAREEGYFRLEWDLAAERARTIASGVPFILPVLIDDTREPDALVPDRFRAVQWTRLPGGNMPPDVLRRFQKLWSHRTGLLKHQAARAAAVNPPATAPAPARRSPWPWVGLGLAAAGAASLVWIASRGRQPAAAATGAVRPVAAASATKSEARQLIAKASALLHALDPGREDFALAEEYCQRALKLDPDDGEVWAIASQLNSAFVYRGWDASPTRKEQTRAMAERAMRLAPASIEARLAQAGAWSTFNINREEREKLLREVVRDDPTNQGALRFLALTVLTKPNGLEEALALNERSAALPGGDPLALFNSARYLQNAKRQAEAYEMLRRSIAQKPISSALVFKIALEIQWKEDLPAAEQTLRQLPQSALQEDRANYLAGLLRYYQGNAAGALETWRAFPRESYKDFIYEGPKGLLVGLAYELDGREAAARIEWRAALPALEKSIAAAPNNAALHLNQAFLLACLGEKAAAAEALRTHEQLAGLKYTDANPMDGSVARVYVRLGRLDEIFAHRRGVSRGTLRVSPDYAALRADPRFARWVESDPADVSTAKVPAATAADKKSVAVLAFANLSSDKEQEYFSDGISEELLNVLAKVPGLKVTARTSSFFFKGKETPIPEIARQLGVAYIVEGSVRKAGDKVRITAQLIKAADGFHVWSDTFTRDLKDIFAVQDEIAQVVTQRLCAQLTGAGESVAAAVATVERGGTRNVEAHELYLQAHFLRKNLTVPEAKRAQAALRRAVEIDPRFARAWAELSRAAWVEGGYGLTPAETAAGFRVARDAAHRALELEPDLVEGLAALCAVQLYVDFDWNGAAATLRRAQALAPGQPEVLFQSLTHAYTIGDRKRAIELGARLSQRDPMNAELLSSYGYALLSDDRPAEAEAVFRRIVESSPDSAWGHAGVALALVAQDRAVEAIAAAERSTVPWARAFALALAQWSAGRRAEADATLRKFVTDSGDIGAFQIACVYAHRGAPDEAFAWLDRALRQRDPGLGWCKSDPFLRGLHRDPRWRQFLTQIGLADEQLR